MRQYSYDANGNQTDVKNTKTGQTESYTYDAENRLSKVSVTDKDGKTAVIQQNVITETDRGSRKWKEAKQRTITIRTE